MNNFRASVDASGFDPYPWRVVENGTDGSRLHGKRHYVTPYSRSHARESVPTLDSLGVWIESRLLMRWRDSSGRKRARYLPAHSGQMGGFVDLTGGGIMRMPNSTNVRTLTTDEKATSTTSCEGDASLTSHVIAHVQGSFDYNPTFPSDKSCT